MNVSDLLIGGSAWWILPVSLLVFGASFGLLPGLMLRLIVLLYPKTDLRRQELFVKLYSPEMGRFGRFEWVFQQLETALRDGPTSRREERQRGNALPPTERPKRRPNSLIDKSDGLEWYDMINITRDLSVN